MTDKYVIAIDGPAGSGKSTVAKLLAERLEYIYVDSGAMYRAVAYQALRAGLDVADDADAIADLARRLDFEFHRIGNGQHLFVDGQDVEAVIRTPQVGNLSSPVSAIPGVRKHLVTAQRRMAEGGGVVMEGRDIGTVVLPHADLKVFLTASPEERARRRHEQLREQGIKQDFDQVLAEQLARDERDSSRAVAPLRPAQDARELNTDGMPVEEIIALLEQWLHDVAVGQRSTDA